MKTLRPVEVSEYYINKVSKGLEQYFWENLFHPIFKILKGNNIINSKDALINAIKSGRIYYQDGAFRGKFSNAVALELEKLGAKFKYNAYYISKNLIPAEYLSVMGIVEAQAAAKAVAINKFLLDYFDLLQDVTVEQFIEAAANEMYRKLELDLLKSFQESKIPVIELGLTTPKVKLPKPQTKNIEKYWREYDKKANELEKEIAKTVRKGEETAGLKEELENLNKDAFENAPTLDLQIDDIQLDEKSKKIAQDYTYNMQYWVKKWEVKNIVKMREEVLDLVQKGARVPTLERYFTNRWNVARNKAHFLAVNESHLAASVIKATQFQMAGCKQFVWGRSSSKEKRLLHEEYYGKTFDFDNPPIIDEKLGIKGLPRQIWNCKCHMLPVVPSLQDIQKVRNAKRNFFQKITNSKQCDNYPWRYRRFGEG
ncbi:MAG: hypothetical protein IKY41_07490 [Clostridia bacterium]|nr:hypothetical protein [Clostridia bacterium]